MDEICAAVGETLGPGDWLTIDQYRIDAFADATGDHQWIHVDPERAAAGPYGATIAHGYLMQSLIPLLAAGLYTIQTGSARINYGSNTIRFPTPVIAGSRRLELPHGRLYHRGRGTRQTGLRGRVRDVVVP